MHVNATVCPNIFLQDANAHDSNCMHTPSQMLKVNEQNGDPYFSECWKRSMGYTKY